MPSRGSDHPHWVQSPVHLRRHRDHTVVARPDSTDPPLVLNPAATALWDRLARPRTLAELAEGADTETVEPWLADMERRALVTAGGPIPPERRRDRLSPATALVAAGLVRSRRRSSTVLIGALSADRGGTPDPAFDDDLIAELARLVTVERAGVQAIQRLRTAGIHGLALKGLATAHLDHPRPEYRSFGDVDLLVRTAQFDGALATLAGLGFVPTFSLGRSTVTAKAVTLRGPEDVVIDLHQRLVRGSYGFLADPAEAFAGPERAEVAGVTVNTLPGPARFVHAALHAVLSSASPATLLDLAILAERIPVEDRHAQARRWRAVTVCDRATALLAQAADAGRSPMTLGPASRFDQWLGSGSYGVVRRELVALAAIRRPGPALRYARAKLDPGAAYLEERGRNRWTHIRQAVSRPSPPSGAR